MMNIMDCVSVIVPIKAENVSLIRLTASGVASRIGFDIDAIDDIKVCISEVFNKLVEASEKTELDRVVMDFYSTSNEVTITFGISNYDMGSLFSVENDAFALAIMETLMDGVTLSGQNGNTIQLMKKLGRTT